MECRYVTKCIALYVGLSSFLRLNMKDNHQIFVSPSMSGFLHFYWSHTRPDGSDYCIALYVGLSSFLQLASNEFLKHHVSPSMSGFLHFYSVSGNPVKSMAPDSVCVAKPKTSVIYFQNSPKSASNPVSMPCVAKSYLP